MLAGLTLRLAAPFMVKDGFMSSDSETETLFISVVVNCLLLCSFRLKQEFETGIKWTTNQTAPFTVTQLISTTWSLLVIYTVYVILNSMLFIQCYFKQ